MKKILCVFLCLILLASALPLNALASLLLPQKLQVIESEAFMGDTSLYEMELPEGVKTIGERAFKSSSITWLKLPASLTSIAEDAFENCHALTLQVWRDSYAHRWCQAHDVRYQVMELPGQGQEYRIHEIFIDENTDGDSVIRTYVSASYDCTLKVEMLSDAGDTVLYSCDVSVSAGAAEKKFDFSPSYLPSWFRLRATILRGSSVECTLTNLHYTSAYDAFNQQQPTDFPEETVLDFGESGYAVLAEGVMPLDAAATVSGDEYTFRTALSLKKGDRVKIKVNGEDELIKIASVTSHSDGTVTVKADPNTYLADFYDVISYSAQAQKSSASSTRTDTPAHFPITTSTSFKLSEHSWISFILNMDLYLSFKYDKVIWGRDYYELDINGNFNYSVDVFLGEKIDTWKLPNPPSIPLLNFVPSFPGLKEALSLELRIPFNMKAELGGKYTYNAEGFFQLLYDPVNKASGSTYVLPATNDINMTASFHLLTGLELLMKATLFEKVTLRASLTAGLDLTGKNSDSLLPQPQQTAGEYIHACECCLDLELLYDIYVRLYLNYAISPTASHTLNDSTITLAKDSAGPLYLSIENSPDSIHKGHIKFGAGLCPNRIYKTAVRTLDLDCLEVTGLPVTVEGTYLYSGRTTDTISGISPQIIYLYPGDYIAEAEYEKGKVQKPFSVRSSASTVSLMEPEISILVHVKDNDSEEPIPGAEITLTLPDESTLTKYSGEDGTYEFESLPAGKYSVHVSKEGYEERRISDLNFTGNTTHGINVNLTKKERSEEDYIQEVMDLIGADTLAQLKAEGYKLRIEFHYYLPENGTGDLLRLCRVDLRTFTNALYPYRVNDTIFRKAQIAIIDSTLFPLTTEDRILLKENLLPNGPYFTGPSIELHDGITFEPLANLNDTLIFYLRQLYPPDGYAEAWYSEWYWDENTFNNKP